MLLKSNSSLPLNVVDKIRSTDQDMSLGCSLLLSLVSILEIGVDLSFLCHVVFVFLLLLLEGSQILFALIDEGSLLLDLRWGYGWIGVLETADCS